MAGMQEPAEEGHPSAGSCVVWRCLTSHTTRPPQRIGATERTTRWVGHVRVVYTGILIVGEFLRGALILASR
jgi:hypothetical protein